MRFRGDKSGGIRRKGALLTDRAHSGAEAPYSVLDRQDS